MKNEKLIPVPEFCQIYQVEYEFLNHLYTSGIINLVIENHQSYIIKDEIPDLEKWVLFHKELEINIPGLEVLSHLLPRLEAQTREIHELKALVQFYQNWKMNPGGKWEDL